jgi:YgiT-type zinc finger domain-containing protein
MKCTIVGCPGTYEPRETVVVERVQGQLMVIEHVPVEVCDVCGDVLFRPETVRHLEALRHTAASPQRTVPLYEYV